MHVNHGLHVRPVPPCNPLPRPNCSVPPLPHTHLEEVLCTHCTTSKGQQKQVFLHGGRGDQDSEPKQRPTWTELGDNRWTRGTCQYRHLVVMTSFIGGKFKSVRFKKNLTECSRFCLPENLLCLFDKLLVWWKSYGNLAIWQEKFDTNLLCLFALSLNRFNRFWLMEIWQISTRNFI